MYMKKFLLGLAFVFAVTSVSAKKVKFAVDMTGIITSTLGIHVVGDFQEAAGYPLNWDPSATTLTKEGSTDIYSIIVNIPAFTKYEYRFVNGDQTYESEFIPDESRVGYNFVDNRWLYVDSLANDTSFVGAILFGGNAPAGLSLVRYKVDMKNALPVSPNGVHVGTNMDAFSPTKVRLYSFGDSIYEIISYFPNNSYTYIYFNGDVSTTTETITGTCSVFGNRGLTLTKDTAMQMVCFSSCSDCNATSIKEIENLSFSFNAFPNPVKNSLTIQSSKNEIIESVVIFNVAGQQVKQLSEINMLSVTLSDLNLSAGLYTVKVSNKSQQSQYLKIIIE